MFKLLPVFLFLTVYSAKAINFTSLADANNSLVATEKADDLRHLSVPKLNSAGYHRRGGGGAYVYFSYGIILGGGSLKATGPNKFSSSGFLYGGDLGVDIMFPARSDRSDNMLTIYVTGLNQETDKMNVQLAGVPIYYTYLRYGGDHGAGFYFQAGADIDYLYGAKDKDGNDLTAHFNRLLIDPTVSIGVHFPYVLMRRRQAVGAGRIFVGPFYSYTISNMSKDDGVDMHGHKIGIKFCYMLMHGQA